MHNSDHYKVLVCLHSDPLREHDKYLGGRKWLLLQPPTVPTRKYGIFSALWRAVPNPQEQDTRENAWILEATWRLVDERVSTRQDPTKYQSLIWILVSVIAASLKRERRRWAEEAGAEVETLLGSDPPIHREAWHQLKGWY